MTLRLIGDCQPNSQEAEQAVIGAIILDNTQARKTAAILIPEDFYRRDLGKLYKIILNKIENGDPIDMVGLIGYSQLVFKKNGAAEISNCVESCPTPVNAVSYAAIVKEMSRRRAVLKLGVEMTEAARDPEAESKTLLSTINRETARIAGNAVESKNIRDIVKATFEQIEARTRQTDGLQGYSTGFMALDDLTGGLCPETLMLIGAWPKIGKTCLSFQLGDAVVRAGGRALGITLEMPAHQIITRLIAQRTKIDGRLIGQGKLLENQWSAVTECGMAIAGSGWAIHDRPRQTISEIEQTIFSEHDKAPLNIVIVDYAQKIREERWEKRYQALGRLANMLFVMSMDLKICCVLASQLTPPDKREAKRPPRVSDLRESGDLGQEATHVILIDRPALRGEDCGQDAAELRLAYNRFGPPGKMKVEFDGPATLFSPIEYSRKENDGDYQETKARPTWADRAAGDKVDTEDDNYEDPF